MDDDIIAFEVIRKLCQVMNRIAYLMEANTKQAHCRNWSNNCGRLVMWVW